MPRAWNVNGMPEKAPKKYAPTRHSAGRQNAKMTSAIAIQPAPPVSPSTHCGVIASEKRRAADAGERAADDRVRVAVARRR